MQSWWNVYLVYEKIFYFDKCNGYAMVLFEHATRGFDNSSLG